MLAFLRKIAVSVLRIDIMPYMELDRHGVMYQLYPQSFKDGDGDGYGDLQGIREKLAYIKTLGINSVWINPIFRSPYADFGYDVADYRQIDPRYGSMETCMRMVDEFHRAGIAVVFDLVLNHTSNEHPWFRESRQSRDNPKSDWYIWRNPRPDGSVPNNWIADFGGAAWEFAPSRAQYYLHSFLPEQPDLNYDNPEVLEAMGDNMRYWFDMGIDGMRLDSVAFTKKQADLPDEPENLGYKPDSHPFGKRIHDSMYFQPEMYDVMRYFAGIVAKEYPDKFLISEAWPPPEIDGKNIIKQLYAIDPKVHAPFNSGLVGVPWNAAELSGKVEEYYSYLGKNDVSVWTLGSHDVNRLANRIGNAQLKNAAMLLLTLPASLPVIVYGDEIGLKAQYIPRQLRRDVFSRFDSGTEICRDYGRLPMPWNAGENAGFSSGIPWLPVPEDYCINNVELQQRDEKSLLRLYRKLIAHHKHSATIKEGNYFALPVTNPNIYSYGCISQSGNGEGVLLNLSHTAQETSFPYKEGDLILNTLQDLPKGCAIDKGKILLRPDEGILFSF